MWCEIDGLCVQKSHKFSIDSLCAILSKCTCTFTLNPSKRVLAAIACLQNISALNVRCLTIGFYATFWNKVSHADKQPTMAMCEYERRYDDKEEEEKIKLNSNANESLLNYEPQIKKNIILKYII